MNTSSPACKNVPPIKDWKLVLKAVLHGHGNMSKCMIWQKEIGDMGIDRKE